MNDLLIIKEKIKKFAGKNDAYLVPALKFLLTLVALLRINSKLGFMSTLASAPVTLIIALAGSFLPINLTLVILALVIIAHVYSLSFEAAILVAALFVILFLLYFRFASKDSIAAILTPVLFSLKIPYVMPVSMGLTGTLSSVVSVSAGSVIYYVLHFISDNADDIAHMGENDSNIASFKDIIDGIVGNKEMIVVTAAFALTVIVVYLIRRMSIDYSWYIAILGGAATCFFVVLIGNVATGAGISLGLAFLGTIISIILNIILQFFCFNLDYNRTEKVQFEDDEYYYYVKAVPKNTLIEKEEEEEITVSRPVRTVAKETPAKSAVRERAAEAARTAQRTTRTTGNSANKGPFGLSGGRPAGEGRRNNDQHN